MKRRSLALFLAFLMAFGSILPVFATEPAVEAVAEEPTPTLTYEDLYVPDAVFAWNAFDKTSADTESIVFENKIAILKEANGATLKIKDWTDADTVSYGDGYLQISGTGNSILTLENAYPIKPSIPSGATYADIVAGVYDDVTLTQTYSTQMTMASLDQTFSIGKAAIGTKDTVPFGTSSTISFSSFGLQESLYLIDPEGIDFVTRWSRAYLAAKNDASLQATFRSPIAYAEYQTLSQNATYSDHVFVVNGTDEDPNNDPCADYSLTGYEADYTAFQYILTNYSAYYNFVNFNPDNNPTLYNNGVAKGVINTTTWAADSDWKDSKTKIWTATDPGEVVTQTRVNTITAPYAYVTSKGVETAGAHSVLNIYMDETSTYTGTKDGTTASRGTAFTAGKGYDARYYSIRIYDVALDATDIMQNHFAELCEYHQIDLAKLEAIGEEGRNVLAATCANMNLTTSTKEEVDAAIKAYQNEPAYAAMYVQDGLLYRWDAYDLAGIDGTSLYMADKDGRGKTLTLDGVTYNSTSKTVDTTNPIDFSDLITRTNGAYDQTQIEFELILTQTSYTGPASYADGTGARPYIALGPIDGGYSGNTVHGWADDNLSYGGYSNFYIALRNGKTTANTTYTFDEGAVDVPYLSSTGIQFAQEPTWAIKRWFGNYVGESYSVGAKITFETLEETAGLMKLELMRDGLASSTYADISYVHGKTAIGLGTKIVPTTYEEALAMSQRNAGLNSTFSNGGANFKIGGSVKPDLTIGYHAFRVYERHLTNAERQQNHFADLCGYYQIDNAAAYNALSDEHKAAIYTQAQFTTAVVNDITKASNKSFDDVTKDQLEDAIEEYVLLEEEEKRQEEEAKKEAELQAAYAAMYVQDGLMYRWDAYNLKSINGTSLAMIDKDGRDKTLTLDGVTYNSTYKTVDTINPIDFSDLITRTNGVYDEDELEYELVMTQTSFNGTHSTNNRPHMLLGPAASPGSGALLTEDSSDIDSYGGYPAFYYGQRANSASVRNSTYYYDAEYKLIGYAYVYVVNSNNVTEYYDATSTKVDSLDVSGAAYNVSVPYFVTTTGAQICTQTWASLKRYVGHEVGQSYSIGGQITFDAANYNMTLTLYRDALACPNGSYTNISYIPGYNASGTGTRIIPESYEDALEMAERSAVFNSTNYPTDSGTFKIAGSYSSNVKLGYHAFRLYNRHLTDTERQQNHFADLCSYHGVDIERVAAYNALSEELKAAIYTQKQFNEAVIDSRTEVSNTSFDDVTKKQLEDAIDAQVANAEYVGKYVNLAKMYVSNSTTFWSAFGAKQVGNMTIGVLSDGAALTVSGGTSAYADGYLRAIGSTLNVTGAYKAPANGQTLNYTTEFVYAGYDSGRTYTGENVTFNQKDHPAFATNAYSTFQTVGVRENARFVDAESKKWHQDWSTAYAEALKDEAKRENFWTPVSSDDYTSLKNAGMNVREVGGTSGNEPIGAYSQTNYETDWEGFKYVIDTLKKTQYYQGYDYVAKGYEGVYNLNIMKNDWNGVAGGWMAQLDYIGSFGPEKGNWSSYDFGVVNTHTWVETVSNNVKVADQRSVDVSAYSGDRLVATKSTSGAGSHGTAFTVQSFDTDVYAIRIYPFALTDTERAQNHFADLASYYAIDNADAFFALSAGSKEALYKSFASTMIKDTDKAALEDAIAAATEREEYVATLSAESYVSFLGYQVRLHDYPGLRSVFEVYKNGEIANATLVEVGAIMAIKGDRTTEDLTVVKNNESGVYEAVGAQMKNVTVYADKAWAGLYENGGKTTFGYTCTFPDLVKDTEEELEPADKLQTALLFRGYAVVEVDGIEFVLYTNMASKFETVSMYELSKCDEFKDYKTSQDVVAKVEG